LERTAWRPDNEKDVIIKQSNAEKKANAAVGSAPVKTADQGCVWLFCRAGLAFRQPICSMCDIGNLLLICLLLFY